MARKYSGRQGGFMIAVIFEFTPDAGRFVDDTLDAHG